MLCTVERVIYPKADQESSNGFSIVSFVCNTHKKDDPLAIDRNGEDLFGKTFKAKGYYLPTVRAIQFDIKGHWTTHAQYGNTLEVESVTEHITENETGIMTYLTSGLIKGLGFKTARAIYKKFGDDTLKVMDTEPQRLLEVSGIKQKKMEQIITSYTAYRGAKDVVSILAPLGISSKRAVKIYNKYLDKAAEICQTHPFRLCFSKLLSFGIADNLSKAYKLSDADEERCMAAMYNILQQAETGGILFRKSSGHLCVSYREWMEKSMQLLDTREVTYDLLQEVAKKMISKKIVKISTHPETKETFVYRYVTALAEHEAADAIVNLISSTKEPDFDVEDEIRLMELDVNFKLAPEQRNADITGLKNHLAVITGGPGTGKTTIINFIQTIYRKNNPNARILLCAPTGRAARRMFESTGSKAFTIHKALNLKANDEGIYEDAEILDYDLIIVDEISMLDMFLARTFFKSIRAGAQVVLIGDANQLPSVGPGAVLSEIISSEVVKVAKLTKVYRQQSESLIALNSLLMCKGKYNLDYGNDFVFMPAKDWEDAAKQMKREYMNAVEEVGIDDVSMLSPFRSNKTLTGVDALNMAIKDVINPPSPSKKEMTAFGKVFREGDKVMQTKTVDDVSNGDIGYITKILGSDGEQIAIIDFGDERIVEYYQSDMETVDWAYATTVHKSQGSEYKIVIFNIMEGHNIMLKRNLAYTAVTRAKTKVIIIGQKSALIQAIQTGIEDEDKRNTMLALRLRSLKQRKETTV